LAAIAVMRGASPPWSWWLVVPVVVCPVLYELVLTHPTYWTLQSALSFHIPPSLFELVLPTVLLVAWSTIAADPRPSIGAALYIAVHLTAVAPAVAAEPTYVCLSSCRPSLRRRASPAPR
jgi:hypothetical protein